MHNNKNLQKMEEKTNSEMRKMFPKDGDDIGIENGQKVDSTEIKHKKHSKLPRS